MKRLLLVGLLFSSVVFAGVESKVDVDGWGYGDAYFGTQCVGGYLFAFAMKGDNRGSISIQQMFEQGSSGSYHNRPIECEVKDDN